MCWTIIDRAFSETAIRASIFSSAGRSRPAAALIARDRTCQVWKVATYGPPTARPDETTYGGTGSESSTGARTETSWPRAIKAWARSRTWFCTPPGVPSEYGHTTPILTGRLSLVQENPLQHVPVLGVGRDALGEGVGAALCHGSRAALRI